MNVELDILNSKNFIIKLPFETNPLKGKDWESLVRNISLEFLLNKEVYMITRQPQKYSYGYEFSNSELLKANNMKYLITYLDRISTKILNDILSTEEFELGHLRLLTSNGLNSITLNGELLTSLFNYPETLKLQICFVDSDGRYFHLYGFNEINIESRIKDLIKSNQ